MCPLVNNGRDDGAPAICQPTEPERWNSVPGNGAQFLNKQYTIMAAIVARFLVYFEVLWRVIS